MTRSTRPRRPRTSLAHVVPLPRHVRALAPWLVPLLFALAMAGLAMTAMQARAASPTGGGEDAAASADRALRERVEDRLARSPSLAGTRIDAQVDGATVTLAGSVGSEGDRQRAERMTRRVRGVEDVENELRVEAGAVGERRSARVPDAELARKVAEALAEETFPGAQADEEWLFGWEVEGDDWEFDVDVDGGSVTLEGSVESHADIARTIRAVRNMPGVRAVTSHLWVHYDAYEWDPYPPRTFPRAPGATWPHPHDPWRYPYGPYWIPRAADRASG